MKGISPMGAPLEFTGMTCRETDRQMSWVMENRKLGDWARRVRTGPYEESRESGHPGLCEPRTSKVFLVTPGRP